MSKERELAQKYLKVNVRESFFSDSCKCYEIMCIKIHAVSSTIYPNVFYLSLIVFEKINCYEWIIGPDFINARFFIAP